MKGIVETLNESRNNDCVVPTDANFMYYYPVEYVVEFVKTLPNKYKDGYNLNQGESIKLEDDCFLFKL